MKEKKLTKREDQVSELLMQGKMIKEIAAELEISENTVSTHIRHIHTKTDTHSIAQLILRKKK